MLFFYFRNSSRACNNETRLEPPSTFHFHSEVPFTHHKRGSFSHLPHNFSECEFRRKASPASEGLSPVKAVQAQFPSDA